MTVQIVLKRQIVNTIPTRSAELSHEPRHHGLPFECLPLSLTELTVRLRPLPPDLCTGESLRVTHHFEHITKAARVGMRLHKLTLVGFTYYDVRRFPTKSQGLCLGGIKELVLEPCLSDEVHVALEHVLNTHPVNRILHIFPDLEKLQICGPHLTGLTLTVPCPLLEELSLSFCPASINVKYANLRSLRLEHQFSPGPPQRAAELHELDMSAWVCGLLDSLTVVLGSYRKDDVFQVQCKPGTAMSATLSYPAEEWGDWVIGVRSGAGQVGQSKQRALKFVCTSSFEQLAWDLA